MSPAAPHSAPRHVERSPAGGTPRVAPHDPNPAPHAAYLLSRQAIHSAEDGECAACAATMLGSGARWPRAAATSRAPPGGLPRPAGRGLRGGPGARPALHCGVRVGAPPPRPPASQEPRPRDTCCRCPAPPDPRPPSPRGLCSRVSPQCAWGGGCQTLYIFRTANATKMAAASPFP